MEATLSSFCLSCANVSVLGIGRFDMRSTSRCEGLHSLNHSCRNQFPLLCWQVLWCPALHANCHLMWVAFTSPLLSPAKSCCPQVFDWDLMWEPETESASCSPRPPLWSVSTMASQHWCPVGLCCTSQPKKELIFLKLHPSAWLITLGEFHAGPCPSRTPGSACLGQEEGSRTGQGVFLFLPD